MEGCISSKQLTQYVTDILKIVKEVVITPLQRLVWLKDYNAIIRPVRSIVASMLGLEDARSIANLSSP
jgi:hypothetical protein